MSGGVIRVYHTLFIYSADSVLFDAGKVVHQSFLTENSFGGGLMSRFAGWKAKTTSSKLRKCSAEQSWVTILCGFVSDPFHITHIHLTHAAIVINETKTIQSWLSCLSFSLLRLTKDRTAFLSEYRLQQSRKCTYSLRQ